MLKNKFNIGLLSMFLFLAVNSNAQFGLKGVLFSPTGDFGFAMKKTFGPELIWKQSFENTFRGRAYLNFALFKPRMDTVRTVSYETSGSGNTILESHVAYGKMWNLTLGFGLDYSPKFTEEWHIKPYLGMDVSTGAHHRRTDTNSGVSSVTEEISTLMVGVVGRVGVEANFEKFGIFIDLTRNYNLVFAAPSFAYTAIGVGVVYNLK